MEEILFNQVSHIGETQTENFEIIDTSDSVDEIYGEKQYRVYHSDGFCFDISKINRGTDDNGVHLGWDFIIFDEWDGFKKASIYYYCKILS